jgi:hypothetical protein
MRKKLEEIWTKRLMALPETGMGYQRVDIVLADGTEVKDALVFNAEEIDVPDEFAEIRIKELRLHGG